MFNQILPLVIFSLSTTLTPGPNNIMVTASGANFGYRRTIPHMLGVAVGFPIMVIVLGTGLGKLFHTVPTLHLILKIIGSLFLLFLAWKVATFQPHGENRQSTKPLGFFQAVLFQWINPKAWVIGLVVISSYTSIGKPLLPQVVLIAMVYLIISFPSCSVWTLFGTGVGKLLKDGKARNLFNISMALLLVLSLIFSWLLK